ncbi:MAG: glycosyltransferase, partial [Candidatus Dojkabacteria bacterium]
MSKSKYSHKKIPTSKLKLAIVADPLYKYGGSEKHLQYILKTFPNSELFVPYYDGEFVKEHFPNIIIHQSFLKRFPFKAKMKHSYLLFHPLAVKMFKFNDFDGVLSHSIIFGKFAKAPKGKKHINSCMSPPKFLWQKEDRSIKDRKQLRGINKLSFAIYSFFMDTFLEDLWKKWDKEAAQKVDHMIANSETVKKRIKKVYDIKADVIYPPVEVAQMQIERPLNRRENWFLYLGRIESYKGVELAIRACVDAQVPLKIVGKGDDEDRMHELV